MNPSPALLAGLLGCAPLCVYAQSYSSAVLADGPLAFHGLGEAVPTDVAINQGTAGATLNGVHRFVQHRVTGAISAGGNPASFFQGSTVSNTLSSITTIPNNAALNPAANQPFTIEAWLRPTVEENVAVGQAPLANRKTDGNRQGWVFFQRASTNDTSRQQGWNFRMYSGSGSGVSIDVTGGTYTTGDWSHVVLVWNGSTATLYVDGNGTTSSAGTYMPNNSTPMGFGAYSDPVGGNPFTGDIDEVAYYPSALTATQVQEHYQAGLDAIPAESYDSLVRGDGAIMQHRMDEYDAGRAVALNQGTIAPRGHGIHFPGVTHSVPGALAAGGDTAMRYESIDKTSNDGGYPTVLPAKAEYNTANFTWEGWVKPTAEGRANAQCVLKNHNPGDTRTGWVLWQRGSSTAAAGHPGGYGWNLRLYNGSGNNATINLTTAAGSGAVPGSYTIGQWQHLAVTFNSATQTASFYINGVLAGSQVTSVGAYVPNPPETDIVPSIGGFPNGTENPFDGDIDEVAFYDKVLSASLISAHHANGINASPATPYATLIASDAPVGYFRMNEVAKAPSANLGTLGAAAAGTLVNSPAPTPGPSAPAYQGFEANNSASAFRGANTYVELNNPSGLNFAGPITLEAWVQPGFQINPSNVIIGHGGNDTFSGELFLRIENGNYEVGGTGGKASAAAPAEDLGTGAWVHLAGTWNAGTWTLYRNGSVFATGADATGPTTVANANWAIGARGRWKNGGGFPNSDAIAQRSFTGGITDAAIYNKALSEAQVRNHFLASIGPVPLTITKPGGVITLEWSNGVLQQSDNLGGWQDVPAAVSPYLPADGTRHFYRLRF